MALSAKNKAGADYQSPEGTTMRTPDILAAFSLLGNILGIIAAIIGFSIAFGHRWHPVIIGGVLHHILILPLEDCFAFMRTLVP